MICTFSLFLEKGAWPLPWNSPEPWWISCGDMISSITALQPLKILAQQLYNTLGTSSLILSGCIGSFPGAGCLCLPFLLLHLDGLQNWARHLPWNSLLALWASMA